MSEKLGLATEDAARVYRERIYAKYESARETQRAPRSIEGLRPRLPYLRKLVRCHFPSDLKASILELGCGHGALLHVLHQAGYQTARGVDVSGEQVAVAGQLGIAGVSQADALETLVATPAMSLDVVVTFDLIEHLSKGEMVPFVDSVQRALKPNGRWIIHVPNAESPFFGRIRYGDFTHELAFTRVSLDQLLRASGFFRVDCFEDRPVPHGIKSLTRALLWRFIRLALLGYLAIETGSVDHDALFSQNFLAVAFKCDAT